MKKLVLRDCELDDNDIELIAESLSNLNKMTGITHIDFSGNFFEKKIKHLFHCFLENKTINKLILQKMNINKINIEILLSSIVNNNIIEHLDLSHNPIKNGINFFREFFSVNHTLKFLALNNCDLTDYYLEMFLDNLYDNTLKLETLELELNMFSNNSAITIKHLFENNKVLKKVSLLYNKIYKSDLEKVLRAEDLSRCQVSEKESAE